MGNIVRRALFTIREETRKKFGTSETELSPSAITVAPERTSISSLLLAEELPKYLTARVNDPELEKLRSNILGSMKELSEETRRLYKSISSQATEHMHAKFFFLMLYNGNLSSEVIMVYGKSTTVSLFLANAAKSRKLEVVVAEGAPM